MKLRNKKTGKVFDVIVREKSNGDGEYSIIVCDLRAIRSGRSVSSILGEYDSLAKLNENWEDYEPAEPLIKDEKIRKAVRAWAEVNDFEPECEIRYYSNSFRLVNWQATIEFNIPIEGLENGEKYTITELCGDFE